MIRQSPRAAYSLSSRARRGIGFLPILPIAAGLVILLASFFLSAAPKEPDRPRILGIAHVQILATDLAESRSSYTKLLGQGRDCNRCEQTPGRSFFVNLSQVISLSAAPSPVPSNLIKEIAFSTDNVPKLRRYLISRNVAVSQTDNLKDKHLSVTDPEGHAIAFLQEPTTVPMADQAASLGAIIFSSPMRLIHAGFIVRDRAATEHFYKDILGFRPYWHGGMKDDQTDWVSMQVPDGTDWLEFMVNVEPDAGQRLRGIMNHIAIGVTDIHATQKKLIEAGAKLTEERQIGRDGKWQLNLYDPDETRVEFMELTPVQKPCCSEFTGPHPGPQPPSKVPSKP